MGCRGVSGHDTVLRSAGALSIIHREANGSGSPDPRSKVRTIRRRDSRCVHRHPLTSTRSPSRDHPESRPAVLAFMWSQSVLYRSGRAPRDVSMAKKELRNTGQQTGALRGGTLPQPKTKDNQQPWALRATRAPAAARRSRSGPRQSKALTPPTTGPRRHRAQRRASAVLSWHAHGHRRASQPRNSAA